MTQQIAELCKLLRRDAVGLRAWGEGRGPFPETVRGVARMKAERAEQAAATIEQLQSRISELEGENQALRKAGRARRHRINVTAG